jgi:hypothetical protein
VVRMADARSPGQARQQALDILREHRFHATSVPRPLHGLLEAIGNAANDLFSRLTVAVGGVGGAWAVLAGVLLAVAFALALRTTRRLLREPQPATGEYADTPLVTAAQLERAAHEAQATGRSELAVRLLFRAGLARLTEQGRLSPADSLPNQMVAREVDSDDFDALARQFDTIVYGRRAAGADDYEQSRRGWTRLHSARRSA